MTDSTGDFKFPECWSNDVRMGALFAPFRLKSVNPTDWDSKMKFWTELIENWAKFNKCPVIDTTNLGNHFKRKGAFPACLDEVVQHLISTKVLVPKEDFIPPNEGWVKWGLKVLVTNPLKWTFNTVKSTIIKPNSKISQYVHAVVVDLLGEELLKSLPCNSFNYGKLFDFEDLLKFGMTEEDLPLVLHVLHKKKKISICYLDEETLVKVVRSGEVSEITEVEKGIYKLEKERKIIEQSLHKLDSEKNVELENIKKHLANKMKNLALISLRRKKMIEKNIEQQSIVLENIQGVLDQINQSKMNKTVVETYQTGMKTLKQVFKENGLTEETVSATVKELKEVLESANDIDEALNQRLEEGSEDLEEELNQLLLDDLPTVPTDELPQTEKSKKDKEKKETKELEKQMEQLSI